MCVKVFVNGEDMTCEGFPQGDNLQKEIAFLIWFAQGAAGNFCSGFELYHKAPRRTNLEVSGKGTLTYIKEKSGILFEVFIDKIINYVLISFKTHKKNSPVGLFFNFVFFNGHFRPYLTNTS